MRSETGRPLAGRADLLVGGLAAAALAVSVGRVLDRPGSFALAVTGVYAAGALAVLLLRPAGLPGPGLGWANRVTLARLVIAVPTVGFVLEPLLGSPAGFGADARWAVIALATLALCLDGVDGWVARRTGSESDFGARFDMETDAALLMVLSILVWRAGQAGPWVLAIGGMRYAFVAAAVGVPSMRAPLPPSFRRKLVCVIQGAGLLVALAPFLPATGGTVVSAVALAGLVWSFAVDTTWLLRNGEAALGGGGTPAPLRY